MNYYNFLKIKQLKNKQYELWKIEKTIDIGKILAYKKLYPKLQIFPVKKLISQSDRDEIYKQVVKKYLKLKEMCYNGEQMELHPNDEISFDIVKKETLNKNNIPELFDALRKQILVEKLPNVYLGKVSKNGRNFTSFKEWAKS